LGAGQQWDALTVTLVDPIHDRSRDLLGLHGHLERIAHVTRPLHGAHPHHLLGGAFVPAPVGLTGEVLADPGPHRLGVHQDSIEVIDDRVDADQPSVPEDRSTAMRSSRPSISVLAPPLAPTWRTAIARVSPATYASCAGAASRSSVSPPSSSAMRSVTSRP